ncbi:hypothetical protein [Curvivirga sp.]|uniref:hypothetical protein n=1 Tax=Curvivirga sp. TaxID=2856848 RepID=UPI003B5B9432
MILNKILTSDKRRDERIHLEDIEVSLNECIYKLTDLSHSGFAIEDINIPNAANEIINIEFNFTLSNREMKVTCRAEQIWQKKNHAGFKFYNPTRKEILDIDYFIKSYQHQIKSR